MTAHRPRPRLRPILGALAVGACSAPHPAQAPPVTLVRVPPSPAEAVGMGEPREFACHDAAPHRGTRVTFRIVRRAPNDAQTAAETRAVYDIEPLDARAASIRVVLESLVEVEATQSAWGIALAKHWLEPRTPFVLTRAAGGWCFGHSGTCEPDPDEPADPAAQHTRRASVAAAIGETAELLRVPEFGHQLDGQRSSGDLRLSLPDRVVRRLALGDDGMSSLAHTARQIKAGFPAIFEVESSDPSHAMGEQRRVLGELRLDQQCRLRSLQAELVGSPTAPGSVPAEVRFVWRFEPAP